MYIVRLYARVVLHVILTDDAQGVESLYVWNGKVETDNEMLLMAKTKTSLVEQVAAHVEEKHPYDVPEVIAVPVDAGSDAYMDWVVRETTT